MHTFIFPCSSLFVIQDLNCGKTALHLVAEKSSLTDVQFLIETCEADVNCVTYSGCSALHIAAGRGDIAIVAYLISMGADPELLTDEGDLALDLSGSEQVCLLNRPHCCSRSIYSSWFGQLIGLLFNSYSCGVSLLLLTEDHNFLGQIGGYRLSMFQVIIIDI